MNKKKHLSKAALLILLLLLLAVLTAVYFVMQKNSVPATEQPPSHASLKTELFSCAEEDIVSVEITPHGGEKYTLVYHDGHLDTPSLKNYPIRPAMENLIIVNASHIQAEETILDTSLEKVDLSLFSLNPPLCQARITYRDQTVHALKIGHQIPHGIPYYYFMLDDDPHIYAGSTDLYDAFSNSFEVLHPVEIPDMHVNLFDLIEVTGENAFKMTYTPYGWQLEEPFSYPLSADKTNILLDNIKNIRFAQYAGKTDEVNLDELGLSDPSLTLRIVEAESKGSGTDQDGNAVSFVLPEKEHLFSYGKNANDHSFYVSYNGTVYIGTHFTMDFIRHFDVREAVSACPLGWDIQAVKNLKITTPDASVHYEIRLIEQLQQNGELITDEFGNILYDVKVLKNGEVFSTDDFLIWFSSLRRLNGAGSLPDHYTVNGEPLAEIEISNDSIKTTVILYPFDPLHAVFQVNGTNLYTIPLSSWQQLLPWP